MDITYRTNLKSIFTNSFNPLSLRVYADVAKSRVIYFPLFVQNVKTSKIKKLVIAVLSSMQLELAWSMKKTYLIIWKGTQPLSTELCRPMDRVIIVKATGTKDTNFLLYFILYASFKRPYIDGTIFVWGMRIFCLCYEPKIPIFGECPPGRGSPPKKHSDSFSKKQEWGSKLFNKISTDQFNLFGSQSVRTI